MNMFVKRFPSVKTNPLNGVYSRKAPGRTFVNLSTSRLHRLPGPYPSSKSKRCILDRIKNQMFLGENRNFSHKLYGKKKKRARNLEETERNEYRVRRRDSSSNVQYVTEPEACHEKDMRELRPLKRKGSLSSCSLKKRKFPPNPHSNQKFSTEESSKEMNQKGKRFGITTKDIRSFSCSSKPKLVKNYFMESFPGTSFKKVETMKEGEIRKIILNSKKNPLNLAYSGKDKIWSKNEGFRSLQRAEDKNFSFEFQSPKQFFNSERYKSDCFSYAKSEKKRAPKRVSPEANIMEILNLGKRSKMEGAIHRPICVELSKGNRIEVMDIGDDEFGGLANGMIVKAKEPLEAEEQASRKSFEAEKRGVRDLVEETNAKVKKYMEKRKKFENGLKEDPSGNVSNRVKRLRKRVVPSSLLRNFEQDVVSVKRKYRKPLELSKPEGIICGKGMVSSSFLKGRGMEKGCYMHMHSLGYRDERASSRRGRERRKSWKNTCDEESLINSMKVEALSHQDRDKNAGQWRNAELNRGKFKKKSLDVRPASDDTLVIRNSLSNKEGVKKSHSFTAVASGIIDEYSQMIETRADQMMERFIKLFDFASSKSYLQNIYKDLMGASKDPVMMTDASILEDDEERACPMIQEIEKNLESKNKKKQLVFDANQIRDCLSFPKKHDCLLDTSKICIDIDEDKEERANCAVAKKIPLKLKHEKHLMRTGSLTGDERRKNQEPIQMLVCDVAKRVNLCKSCEESIGLKVQKGRQETRLPCKELLCKMAKFGEDNVLVCKSLTDLEEDRTFELLKYFPLNDKRKGED